MPPIQRADISRSLAKKFNIVGFAGPESLSPELVPVVIVDVLGGRPTNPPAAGGARIGPTAAQFPTVRLNNPPGSGKVLEVYRVIVTPDITSTLNIFTRFGSGGALATVGSSRWQDKRMPGDPVGSVTADDLVAITATFGDLPFRALGDTPFSFDVDITLLPNNDAVEAQSSTANQLLHAAFQWRERTLEPTDIVS